MEYPSNEILIDYLDNMLDEEDASRIDNLARKDLLIAGELQYLKLAVETVRLHSICEQVSAVRKSRELVEVSLNKPVKGFVRGMYKTGLRIAAILMLLLGSAILFKYISVSNLSLYEKQFASYELTSTRGTETKGREAEAYRNKNWNEVISIFNNDSGQSNKARFLAAMSEMQLKHFAKATLLFENILDKPSGDNSFQEDAEYYLSLAYLMDHQENKSIQLLNKIKADTGHTYYLMASKISAIDLKIIQLKNK